MREAKLKGVLNTLRYSHGIFYVAQLVITFLPITVGHFIDTIIIASTEKE